MVGITVHSPSKHSVGKRHRSYHITQDRADDCRSIRNLDCHVVNAADLKLFGEWLGSGADEGRAKPRYYLT